MCSLSGDSGGDSGGGGGEEVWVTGVVDEMRLNDNGKVGIHELKTRGKPSLPSGTHSCHCLAVCCSMLQCVASVSSRRETSQVCCLVHSPVITNLAVSIDYTADS